jgi:hypothetical protein
MVNNYSMPKSETAPKPGRNLLRDLEQSRAAVRLLAPHALEALDGTPGSLADKLRAAGLSPALCDFIGAALWAARLEQELEAHGNPALQVRRAMGLSQQKFARQIGCSFMTQRRLEGERRLPQIPEQRERLFELAKQHNVLLPAKMRRPRIERKPRNRTALPVVRRKGDYRRTAK